MTSKEYNYTKAKSESPRQVEQFRSSLTPRAGHIVLVDDLYFNALVLWQN
jgi:hypothetical protein